MRLAGLIAIGLLSAALARGESTAANVMTAGVDGWHTWQLEGTEPVAEMCCFSWQRSSRTQNGCNLDGGHVSYGDGGDCSAEAGYVQVYALVENGRIAKIRVLSSECPVTTAAHLTDHGVISTEDNIRWFRDVIEDSRIRQDIREEALFGLVQSRSDEAFEYIDNLLSRR